MTKEIEDIIMNKMFFELTSEEKTLIQEFAETEVDFDQLKHVFLQVNEIKNMEKPQVDKAVKSKLDVLFDTTYTERRLVWYNKLWLFLWPEDVRFYARPLLQFTTILALLITVVTFAPIGEKEQLAMNEVKLKNTVEEKPLLDKEEEALDREAEVEIDNNFTTPDDLSRDEEEVTIQATQGWKLMEEQTTLSLEKSEMEILLEPADAVFSGGSEMATPASDSYMDEVDDRGLTDEAIFSRSSKIAPSKALSPKEKPEVFDLLTALY